MDLNKFAFYLEKAGYKGASDLIEEELLPLAREKRISLLDAALEYANGNEEQDTSWSQLYYTLQRLGSDVLNSSELDINRPIESPSLPLFP
ncbi:MAG: hypothetical protein PHT44_01255 [Candidatus Portnoybacteria bacterium]|nr:hypothetical protein [Candidatus Portnoybacteria bacterium]MDD4982771.1 hypothetical protein [Candidatus Portnoybacteria bacterium]